MLVAALIMPPKYEASSTITVADPSNNVSVSNMVAIVNSFAQRQIATCEEADPDASASVSIGSTSQPQTLTVTVVSPDAENSVSMANLITRQAADDADEMFATLQEKNESVLVDLASLNSSEDVASVLSGSLLQDALGSGRTFEFCTFVVEEALLAEKTGIGILGFCLIGLLGGFLVSILALIVLDMVKAPLIRGKSVQSYSGYNLLNPGSVPYLGGQIWANLQFSAADPLHSVCLIPLSGDSAEVIGHALAGAIEQAGNIAIVKDVKGEKTPDSFGEHDSGVCIYTCEQLNRSVSAAYCANESDVTIVCACEWADSREDLEESCKELSLTKARVAGIVLI